MFCRGPDSLHGGILFWALLSGMMDVRLSKQQQNGRITYNFCNTSDIPSPIGFSQPGYYLKELIYPTLAEKLGFTPARGTPTTSKQKSPNSPFPDYKRD